MVDASQGSRRRRWPIVTLHSTWVLKSCRCSTRWTCPRPTRRTPSPKLEDVIGIDASEAIPCLAKSGMGIDEILEAVVARCHRPKRQVDGPLRAMIIDSWFDSYVGVVMLVRVVDGELKKASVSR